jgi:predicted RNA-binding Zn-ribbon protein involved in translation (DUF1610 family)
MSSPPAGPETAAGANACPGRCVVHQCPDCGHSRWVYYRSVPLGDLARSLTGWSRYECLNCGWRGWRPSTSSWRAANLSGRQSESGPRSAALRRLRERLAVNARRPFDAITGGPLRRTLRWSLAIFTVGLLTGALLFGGDSAPGETVSEEVNASHLETPVTLAPRPSEDVPLDARVSVPLTTTPTAGQSTVLGGSPTADSTAAPEATAGRRSDATPARESRALAAARTPVSKAPRYRGSLVIDSDPRGANVTVDGRVVGSTPIVLDDVAAGSCVVRVQSNGYELWSTAARIVANKKTRVVATLQRSNQ